VPVERGEAKLRGGPPTEKHTTQKKNILWSSDTADRRGREEIERFTSVKGAVRLKEV